ncbi:hypothetical protein BN179_3040002 [Clostridioides difficile T6]|nr:hypothetical protein BN179_3040002 [Clostridioides difficile T6]CCL66982.1 hypothetical protein BN183_3680039 [Clostridioides difficile E7]
MNGERHTTQILHIVFSSFFNYKNELVIPVGEVFPTLSN